MLFYMYMLIKAPSCHLSVCIARLFVWYTKMFASYAEISTNLNRYIDEGLSIAKGGLVMQN